MIRFIFMGPFILVYVIDTIPTDRRKPQLPLDLFYFRGNKAGWFAGLVETDVNLRFHVVYASSTTAPKGTKAQIKVCIFDLENEIFFVDRTDSYVSYLK